MVWWHSPSQSKIKVSTESMSWSAFSSCCAAIALGVILGVITRRGLWSILRTMPPEKEEERNPEKALTEKKGLEFGKRETEEEETSVVLFSIFSSLLPFFCFRFFWNICFFKLIIIGYCDCGWCWHGNLGGRCRRRYHHSQTFLSLIHWINAYPTHSPLYNW